MNYTCHSEVEGWVKKKTYLLKKKMKRKKVQIWKGSKEEM